MGLREFLYQCLYAIEPKNKAVYRLCKLYADRYRGENNRDHARNGEFQYLNAVLPECRVVFDVGACYGKWTNEALSINSGLQVHCFEPGQATFREMSKNIGNRAVINNIGLSDQPGTATFYPFTNIKQASSLYLRDGSPAELGEQSTEEVVELSTVDRYSAVNNIKRIDLMKIDVEGHEYAVLKGASRMMSERRIPRIQFEYGSANIHSRVFFKDLFNLLNGHGYRIYKLYRSGVREIPRYTQDLDNFQYANYVAELPDELGQSDPH